MHKLTVNSSQVKTGQKLCKLSSLKDLKIRLFNPKDKKSPQKLSEMVTPSKAMRVQINQMTYIPMDY